MAPHSSTLAWKIPWTEEPGRLQSMGRWESDTTERLHFHFSLSCIGEGNGNPLQCSCLENPRDGEPGGLPSMGLHRVGHDWSDLVVVVVGRIKEICIEALKIGQEDRFLCQSSLGLNSSALSISHLVLSELISCGFCSSYTWVWGWTIKEAEHWRIDAFKLWCWRRVLRIR